MGRYFWLISSLVGLAVFTFASLALGQDPTPVVTAFETIGDAIKGVSEAVGTAQGAGWNFTNILVLVVTILKAFWLAVGRIPKLAKEIKKWGVEINIAIPAIIALLHVFVGGGSWKEAILLVMAGPLMGLLHDAGRWIWKLKKKAGSSADLDDGAE